MLLITLLKTMRPKQWPKNVFIFTALVFDVPQSLLELRARLDLGQIPFEKLPQLLRSEIHRAVAQQVALPV